MINRVSVISYRKVGSVVIKCFRDCVYFRSLQWLGEVLRVEDILGLLEENVPR
jgi:hypothetical protein